MKAGTFGAAIFFVCLALMAECYPACAQAASPKASVGQDILLQGKIQCSLKREVLVPFKGIITGLSVQSGQPVKAGDVLAHYTIAAEVVQQLQKQLAAPQIFELEGTLAGADKAMVALEEKRSELKGLVAENMAPAQSLEQVQKEIQYTGQNIAAARQRLQVERDSQKSFETYLKSQLGGSLAPIHHPSQPATLTAPIKGNVIAIQSNLCEGAAVDAGAPAFLIGVIDPMVMHAQIHESDMPKVALGDKAEVTLESVPDRTFEATVTRISMTPIVTGLEQPSYYEIELTIPNPGHIMKEGFKGQVVLHSKPSTQ